jgi:pimeloyl-ACP methyl ester carboxylesterase
LTAGDWPSITVPTLLLLGDSDKMVSLEETGAVHKGIPGAQLEILLQTPHPIEQVDTMMLAGRLRVFYQD